MHGRNGSFFLRCRKHLSVDHLHSSKNTCRDIDICFFKRLFKAKLFDMQCFGDVSLLYILLGFCRLLDEKNTLGSLLQGPTIHLLFNFPCCFFVVIQEHDTWRWYGVAIYVSNTTGTCLVFLWGDSSKQHNWGR